jgi:exodeoxyribonuclease X
VDYLIGHNIDSDWRALGSPEVKRICTLAMAKHLWPELGSYKLAALIFHLYEPATARELTQNAHAAETDLHLTATLLDHLLWELGASVSDWESLWAFSEAARIPVRIGFSKYGPKNGLPGMLYSEVPSGMLKWICDPVRVQDMDPWEVKAAQAQLRLRGGR